MTDKPNEDLLFLEAVDKKGDFYLQARYIMFTYKTHLDKKAYAKWWKITMDEPISFLRIAHENGKDDPVTPYEHTHVLIEYSNKRLPRITNCRKFDYPNLCRDKDNKMVFKTPENKDKKNWIHPHIQTIKGSKGFANARNYIAKEDPDNEDLKKVLGNSLSQKVDLILAAESLEEAIKIGGDSMKDIIAIIQLRNNVKRVKEYPPVELQKWHERPWHEIFQIIAAMPPNRDIHWIYDTNGNTCKSIYAAWITEQNKDWICIPTLGRVCDFLMNLQGEMDDGWTGKGIILDFPRDFEDKEHLYTIIEYCINGSAYGTKYKGGKMKFGRPIIWVFSNFTPMYHKLSKDRWDIIIPVGNDTSSINESLDYMDSEKIRYRLVPRRYQGAEYDLPPKEVRIEPKPTFEYIQRTKKFDLI